MASNPATIPVTVAATVRPPAAGVSYFRMVRLGQFAAPVALLCGLRNGRRTG